MIEVNSRRQAIAIFAFDVAPAYNAVVFETEEQLMLVVIVFAFARDIEYESTSAHDGGAALGSVRLQVAFAVRFFQVPHGHLLVRDARQLIGCVGEHLEPPDGVGVHVHEAGVECAHAFAILYVPHLDLLERAARQPMTGARQASQ